MRSLSQWLQIGGALGFVLLVLGAARGGPPATGNPAEAKKPAGEAKDDLKLTKRRAPAEAADGDLIDKTDRQNRISVGFFRAEVRNALNRAREMMGANPEQAEDGLKLLLDKVHRASEIAPDVRAQLVTQIETALRSAHRQAQANAERQLRTQQASAEREARERIERELSLSEEKVDQIMSRYNALILEERYRDAEALADIAEELKPGTPGLRGAELTARMAGYQANTFAVLDMRRKGFVDTLYQIELSHVPAADEPPVLYPDPEAWQLLTERRKKYKAVDVTQHGPNETKILAALDERTELDFVEQPLTDVMDYLKQRHGIEIQLDQKALADAGLGTDLPVTRSIKGITLRSALKLLLGEMDLTYVLRNEVLLITSRTEAENMLSTRVYPVADLVIPIPQARGGGMGGGMGGGTGMGGMGGGMTGGMGGMGMGGMGMGGMGGMGMGGMGGGMF